MSHNENRRPDKFSSRSAFAFVILLTIAARSAVLFFYSDGLQRDTDTYGSIAAAIRSEGVFGYLEPARDGLQARPTAYRPPLYPLLLSIFVIDNEVPPVLVGTLHLVIGVLTVGTVWIIGKSWNFGNWTGVSALLTAFDPILLFQSTQLMTETLATLLAVASLAALTQCLERFTPGRSIFAGILIGLACLCRPTFLPWGGLVFLSAFLATKLPVRQRVQFGGLLLLGIGVTLLPWGIRNWLQFGEFTITTTHGGYTLLLGNNPEFYRFLRDGNSHEVWDSRGLDESWLKRSRLRDTNDDLFDLSSGASAEMDKSNPRPHRTDLEDDRLAYDYAKKFIRAEPKMFLYACAYRILSFWHVLPQALNPDGRGGRESVRWWIAGWYLLECACCVIGVWMLKGKLLRVPWLWGLLLCLTFTAVHAVYWSNMRMRAPVMPFVALLATAGIRGAFQGKLSTPMDDVQ